MSDFGEVKMSIFTGMKTILNAHLRPYVCINPTMPLVASLQLNKGGGRGQLV